MRRHTSETPTPLVDVDMPAGKPPAFRTALGGDATVQVLPIRGRDADEERRFFAALAGAPHGLGPRRGDVVAGLVEAGRRDRSVGNGEALLA